MTGPPYPPPPPSESGGIGELEIGVSPIGVLSPFSVWDTIISQYANSPAITGILTSFAEAIDQTQNFENFYSDVWDVLTANDFGLDIWGRIVGINRVINIAAQTYFGFAEAAALEGNIGIGGFNQAPFYSGAPVTSNYRLNIETFRQLILAKMAFNVTDGTIPSINRILMNLFPGLGNAFVQEGQQQISFFGFAESGTAFGFNQAPFYSGIVVNRMTMIYTFAFQLTAVQLGVAQSGVLPRPPGVQSSILILLPTPPPVNNPPFAGPLGQHLPFAELPPDPYPLRGFKPPPLPISVTAVRVDNPPGPIGRKWPFAEQPPSPYPIKGFKTLPSFAMANNPPFAGPPGLHWPFAELPPDPYPIDWSGFSTPGVPESILAIPVDNPPIGWPPQQSFLAYADLPPPDPYPIGGFLAPGVPAQLLAVTVSNPLFGATGARLPFADVPPEPTPIKGYRLFHPLADQNLLTNSQTLSNAAWTQTDASAVGGITAPDSTATAFKLTEDAVHNFHQIQQGSAVLSTALPLTYIASCYVKPAQRNFGITICDLVTTNGAYNFFTMSASPPTVQGGQTFGAGFTFVSAGAVTDSLATGSGGNGWYRVYIVVNAPSLTSVLVALDLQAVAGTSLYTGDGSSGVNIWGAQLNYGNALKPYTPTTTSALYGF